MPARHVKVALPSMGDEDWHAVREPIEAGWLTQGSTVAAFERAFDEGQSVSYALVISQLRLVQFECYTNGPSL